jgi:hypothetical protein
VNTRRNPRKIRKIKMKVHELNRRYEQEIITLTKVCAIVVIAVMLLSPL